ncbi:hypothetical protein B0T26DRAFT_686721, partial [Lasiosphaeria miniovina]
MFLLLLRACTSWVGKRNARAAICVVHTYLGTYPERCCVFSHVSTSIQHFNPPSSVNPGYSKVESLRRFLHCTYACLGRTGNPSAGRAILSQLP